MFETEEFIGADHSVFYYTYSTVAQTLAGAFGFLVAVVLYQMQNLRKTIEDEFKKPEISVDWDVGSNEWDQARLEKDWSPLANILSKGTAE